VSTDETTPPEPVRPADPRVGWTLPAFGEMAQVVEVDELATRVLAPNPSPMTLDGTNTYVLGAAGSGAAVVVDPGPTDADHLARVRDVVAARDAEVAAVVVTHHHLDHTEAAKGWAASFGARLYAPRREDAGPDGEVVVDRATIEVPGLTLRAVATPGHTRDHVAYRLPNGAMLTGDHVLGRGTSVVAYPDGDLVAYLDSLRRVLDLGPAAMHPGHGPSLTEDPTAVLDFYLDHRAFRRRQVLAVLARGPATPREVVAEVYAEVDRGLWDAAERSTRALVHALVAEGIARQSDDDRVHLI
jgi:glyoxylase-like metal-dependent hydrolase (beta-lactamase superfamily II)